MPPASSLTPRIKAQRTPLIMLRDYENGEPTCVFCEQRFIQGNTLWMKTWEHLDGDTGNEALWNLAWAHKYCNNRKNNSIEFTVIADDKTIENKKWESEFDFEVFEREREKTTATQDDTHKEMDLNTTHFKVTTEYLAEKISDEGYPEEDAIYSIVARCRKRTGHGSHQAVRGYLKELCCTEGKYRVEKTDDGKKIFRREKLE